MNETTPNCRCKPGTIKIYLDYTNEAEGKLIVDHEPPVQSKDHPEGHSWPGGVTIERQWKTLKGVQKNDYVVLNFAEAEKVRDALNVFLWDHS